MQEKRKIHFSVFENKEKHDINLNKKHKLFLTLYVFVKKTDIYGICHITQQTLPYIHIHIDVYEKKN